MIAGEYAPRSHQHSRHDKLFAQAKWFLTTVSSIIGNQIKAPSRAGSAAPYPDLCLLGQQMVAADVTSQVNARPGRDPALLGHGRVLPGGYRCTGKRAPITAWWARAPLVYMAPGTRPSLGSTD